LYIVCAAIWRNKEKKKERNPLDGFEGPLGSEEKKGKGEKGEERGKGKKNAVAVC